jgi:hypothetical protein
MKTRANIVALGFSCFMVIGAGCQPKRHLSGSRANEASQSDGSGVQMALRALSGDQFPEIDFATFMGKGALGAPQIDRTGTLPGRIFETFSPTMNIQVYPLNSAALRRETISVNSSLSNSRVVQAGMALNLSGQLTAGAKIEIVRNFKDSSAAAHALPFNVMQLPFGAENALALSEGTYVSVPISGTVALNVNGAFLARNGSFDKRLFEFLRAGGSGTLSGSMQGALLANGRWRMQILRLAGNKVRVRVVEEDHAGGEGSVAVSGQSVTTFTYVPLGVAARAFDLSTRLINNARTQIGKVSDVQRFLKVPVLSLPQPIQRAKDEASTLPTFDDETGRKIDEGIRLTDRAVDMARQGSQALQSAIDNAVGNQLQKAIAQANAKVDAVDGFLQRITNFTYNADAAFQMSGEFSRQHRFIADYVFDLSTQEAKLAYDHAVSGRSIWLGAKPNGTNWGSTLANFTVAERIAAEDTGLPSPRILRNVLGEGTKRSRAISVRFSGLMASTGFSESWRNNSVWARDASGATESWRAALWQFERNVNVVRNNESEQLGSGILAPAESGSGQSDLGTYWFAWKRRLASAKPTGMQTLFSEVMNYVGPVGFAYGIPKLFKGEFDGDKEGTLLVLFSREGTRGLFDAAKVSDDLLWKALGNVANTFDNTFGLPYNTFGGLPSQYSGSVAAKAACEVVSKNWGGGYCSFFGNEFLPKFIAARQNPDQWQRMKVFESFYTKGFLANKIGARLLVRYLIEVATLAYGKEAPKAITLQFAIRNAQDSSAYASPSFTSGTPSELQVLDTLGMMM